MQAQCCTAQHLVLPCGCWTGPCVCMNSGLPWTATSLRSARSGIGKSEKYLLKHHAELYDSLSVALPRRRLDGCSCFSPLAHFYIHHSDSSIRELHPFTTITHLASQDIITDSSHDDIDIQFLFRKQGVIAPAVAPEAKRGFAQAMFGMLRQIRRQRPESQWTNRLAGLAVEHNSMADARGIPVSLRLEGPYFTPADPKRYRTVVCLVAGTGISGALAIAGMFQEIERQASSSASDGRHLGEKTDGGGQASVLANEKSSSVQTLSQTRVWSRCIVVWSVREDCFVDLPGLQSKLQVPPCCSNPILRSNFNV